MRENEISEELLSHSSEGSVCIIVSGSKFLRYLVAKPLIWSEAEGDLVVIETSI